MAGASGTLLATRSRIIRSIRSFFFDARYLEVETPYRIPAPAPEPYIDAIPADGWYLQTSPELCMKRLLAAGHERIFQICRCWRSGERGRLHLTEFTMLEWYRAGIGYEQLMDETERLLRHVADDLEELPVSIPSTPFKRLTVDDCFNRWAATTADEAIGNDSFDRVMTEQIEPALGKDPVFVHDYPAERAALARLKSDRPGRAERFELYAGGIELANGFTELTDPAEQRQRFTEDREHRRERGADPYPMPEPFLSDLAAMPPASGIALGVDRLVMFLTGASRIDDVVAFTPERL